jgi:hypothetical protein
VGTLRKFASGDVVSIVADFDRCWCEVRVNMDEFVQRFKLPTAGHSNYFVGVRASECFAI